MKRREFITLLGGAAAWPLTARAQQSERMRRIVFLHGIAEHDPEAKARVEAFRQGLEALGWVENRNIQIAHRYSGGGFLTDLDLHQRTGGSVTGPDCRQQLACYCGAETGDQHYPDSVLCG